VAGKEVLVGNRRMMHSHGVHMTLGAEEVLQAGEQRARTGVMVAVNRELAAVLAISDPLKAEAPAVVQALKKMGIRSVMMTGDNANTARVVAEEVRPTGRVDGQERSVLLVARSCGVEMRSFGTVGPTLLDIRERVDESGKSILYA
jgi:P-type E1-E2 ATPase